MAGLVRCVLRCSQRCVSQRLKNAATPLLLSTAVKRTDAATFLLRTTAVQMGDASTCPAPPLTLERERERKRASTVVTDTASTGAMHSTICTSAAHTADACATDTAGNAKRTRQISREVHCHWRWRCAQSWNRHHKLGQLTRRPSHYPNMRSEGRARLKLLLQS